MNEEEIKTFLGLKNKTKKSNNKENCLLAKLLLKQNKMRLSKQKEDNKRKLELI